MAGALVAFLLVIGIVIFDAWPKAVGGLFGTDTADVVDEAASTSGAAGAGDAPAKGALSSKAKGGGGNSGQGASSEKGG
jgi:hypothetical protein